MAGTTLLLLLFFIFYYYFDVGRMMAEGLYSVELRYVRSFSVLIFGCDCTVTLCGLFRVFSMNTNYQAYQTDFLIPDCWFWSGG